MSTCWALLSCACKLSMHIALRTLNIRVLGAQGSGRLRAAATLAAVIVTILWSSSYVLIKWGLQELPPLYFAALRYSLAFGLLAAISLGGTRGKPAGLVMKGASMRMLLVAGVCGYTLAQGLQFVGLYFLPAITTSFILGFTPVFVLVLSWVMLKERASLVQVAGLAIALLGAYFFFYERLALQGQLGGIFIVLISGVAWAVYLLVVRALQRTVTDSLRLTTTTMGIGAAGIALLAAAAGEYAPISLPDAVIIVCLSTANTALAFVLWNWALKTLPAFELSVVQNAMLVEIALFAWAFLGEAISLSMALGMALTLVGIALVQLRAAAGAKAQPQTMGVE
jgi:drug/metabolite transporter (DMT)-like permease